MIGLLRGQVACPVLANLAELGWLDHMAEAPFSCASFPEAAPAATNSIFKYLAALGLLIEEHESPGRYVVSDFGRKVFARYGSFCILNSYEGFFQNLKWLLFVNNSNPRPAVNRLRNVFGSGHLHARKFFLPALQRLAGRSFPFVVDLGCGNGQFLQQAVEARLTRKVGGVDISASAVVATAATIDELKSDLSLHIVEADASRVQTWSGQLPWYHEAGLFSMWFLLHEFSQGVPETVIKFLRELNSRYPSAELVIGELVRLPEQALANNKTDSIMPEFLLFHELSGQGVLSWGEWQDIRHQIPFRVTTEYLIDEVLTAEGMSVPSSFIWHVKPLSKHD
jgi:SAM-dependent methyltransferase